MDDHIKATELIVKETFHSFNIEVSDCKMISVGGINRVSFTPPPGIRIEQILSLRRELQASLGAESIALITPVPGTHYCAVDYPGKEKKRISFEHLINTEEWFEAAISGKIPLCIGMGMDKKPVMIEMNEGVSLLIRGGVPADEEATALLKTIIMSTVYTAIPIQYLKVIVLDPTQADLEAVHPLQHIEKPVAVTAKESVEALHQAVEEMKNRYSLINEGNCRSISSYNEAARIKEGRILQHILVVINGLEDFFILDEISREFEQLLTELLSRGQRVGINVVMRMGCGCESYVPNTIYANCKYMAHFQTINEDRSEENNGKLEPHDLLGSGDMLFVKRENNVGLRVQTPLLTNEDIKKRVEAMCADQRTI